MKSTGKCKQCNQRFELCKFNSSRQKYCTAEACKSASRKNSRQKYRVKRRQESLVEQARIDEQIRRKREGREKTETSKNTVLKSEISSDMNARVDPLWDIAKSLETSLSGILFVLQGLTMKFCALEDEQDSENMGDLASSFILDCYERGRSLFLNADSEPKKLLTEFLYAIQNSHLARTPAPDPTKVQLGRPSLNP